MCKTLWRIELGRQKYSKDAVIIWKKRNFVKIFLASADNRQNSDLCLSQFI